MYYYIVNPTAGRGTINSIQDKLQSNLEALGIAGEFVKTAGPGDATRLAEKAIAAGNNTIVVVGGDETVNEVLNGLGDKPVAIGIVPVGRSNKLAHQLGIQDWKSAGPILAGRRLVSYNLIASGQKVFLSDLSLGFETDLDKQLEPKPDKLRHRLPQFVRSFRHGRTFQALATTIKVDGRYELDCQLFSLKVSNQKFHDPSSDNKLLVSLSSQPNRRQLATYLWRGNYHNRSNEDHVDTRFYAKRIIIDTEPSTGIMIDGKVSGRTPIAIRLTDQEVNFISGKPANSFKPDKN